MISFLSLVTSVKDYIEIAHKLIESSNSSEAILHYAPYGASSFNNLSINNYTDLGAVLTYIIISIKQLFMQCISLNWFQSISSLPIIVPDIASAMLSEISVLDGFFHTAFNFLDTPLSYGNQNVTVYGLEKFVIGFINSFFLFLPTSTAHIITLRRFVMQGLEAGYLAGLGTIAGNLLWICSIIFGWRFFVIPWLSFDVFRYLLGFMLLIKYFWDSSKERRMVVEDLSKVKIVLLNFLLALTEQTCIYPFINNISISPEASVLESFAADNWLQFIFIHSAYVFGILIGSLSLLKFTCWFWENPAFNMYMWFVSYRNKTVQQKGFFNLNMPTNSYYKIANFALTYLTMVCAISSFTYYGLDYTLTNPLGFIPQDRLINQKALNQNLSNTQSYNEKLIAETSFLSVNATDKNRRTREGVRARRERWKERLVKYQALDSSVQDQGTYSFLTLEDLNYGFDRFWLRRKMRNHKINFRLVPGPFMRSVKKQLNKNNLADPNNSKGVEFFRLLFEQYYHASFHKTNAFNSKPYSLNTNQLPIKSNSASNTLSKTGLQSIYPFQQSWKKLDRRPSFGSPLGTGQEQNLTELTVKTRFLRSSNHYTKEITKNSALRKFLRNINSRIKLSEIDNSFSTSKSPYLVLNFNKVLGLKKGGLEKNGGSKLKNNFIFSKKWKSVFSKMWHNKPYSYANTTAIQSNSQQLETKQKTQDFIIKPFFRNVFRKIITKKPFIVDSPSLSMLIENKGRPSNGKSASEKNRSIIGSEPIWQSHKKTIIREKLSKKDRQILRYRTLLLGAADKKTINKAQTLLHPLKFYLQKEQAFARKFKYYGTTVFRKLSVGNNAPYYKTMMKRFFYYYKPTLRWKRTINFASLSGGFHEGFRKKSRVAKKLMPLKALTDPATLLDQNLSADKLDISPSFWSPSGTGKGLYDTTTSFKNLKLNVIEKPTHSYSVLGKQASRYRYQIYRDVVQHWYYTPFNRLLLKLDVDNFMARQPKAHFLTKNEEHLLHVRRFLLGQLFDSVRWYRYMQHYSAMKNNIGGSKSFASRIYNQQFQGTFKKVRHLFAITPSQSFIATTKQKEKIQKSKLILAMRPEMYNTKASVLKFDQPLYNEFKNNPSLSVVNSAVTHEELLKSPPFQKMPYSSFAENEIIKEDLISQSSNLANKSLVNTATEKKQLISKLVHEKNYWQLTQLLFLFDRVRSFSQSSEAVTAKVVGKSSTYFKDMPYPFGKGHNTVLDMHRGLEKIVKDKSEKTNSTVLPFILSEESSLNPSGSSPANKYPQGSHSLLFAQKELSIKLLKECKRRVNDREFLKNYITHRIDKKNQQRQDQQELFKNRLQRLNAWLTPTTLVNKKSNTPGALDIDPQYLSSNLNKTKAIVPTTGIQKAFQDSFYLVGGVRNNRNGNYQLKENQPLQDFFVVNAKVQHNMLSSLNLLKKISWLETQSLKKTIKQNNVVKGKSLGLQTILSKLIPLQDRINTKIKVLTKYLTTASTEKNLSWWRKKQQASTRRKKSRKKNRFKKLNKKKEASLYEMSYKQNSDQVNMLLRFKKDNFLTTDLPSFGAVQNIEPWISKTTSARPGLYTSKTELVKKAAFKDVLVSNIYKNKNFWNRFFTKHFLKKRSGLAFRRYKVFPKNTGYSGIRKPKYINKEDAVKEEKQQFLEARARKSRLNLQSLEETPTLSGFDSLIKNEVPFGQKPNFLNKIPISNLRLPSVQHFVPNSVKKSFLKLLTNPFNRSPKIQSDPLSKQPFLDAQKDLKKLRIKKRIQRKKASKQKSLQKINKYRKRKIQGAGKIRVLRKKIKTMRANLELQKWWWQNFIPAYRAALDRSWQHEKNRELEKKLSLLNPIGFKKTKVNSNTVNNLEIENTTYDSFFSINSNKSINAIKLQQQKPTMLTTLYNTIYAAPFTQNTDTLKQSSISAPGEAENIPFGKNTLNAVNNLKRQTELYSDLKMTVEKIRRVKSLNPLPFYAGWDESLRKFIVTNRFLSRREAGLTVYPANFNFPVSLESQNSKMHSTATSLSSAENRSSAHKSNVPTILNAAQIQFTKAPMRGLNEGSFIYNKTEMPFNTYTIDQFNGISQSFYAPLGWRRFEFRHSILKRWFSNTIKFPNTNNKGFVTANNVTWIIKQKQLKENFQLLSSFAANLEGDQKKGLNNKESLFKELTPSFVVKPGRFKKSSINTSAALAGNIKPEFKQLHSKYIKLPHKINFFALGSAFMAPTNNYIEGSSSKFDLLNSSLQKVKLKKNLNRRTKKRYKIIKDRQDSMPTVELNYMPTGTLLTEVLPAHYLSIFDNQYRFPSARYLKMPFISFLTSKISNMTENEKVKGLSVEKTESKIDSQIDRNNKPAFFKPLQGLDKNSEAVAGFTYTPLPVPEGDQKEGHGLPAKLDKLETQKTSNVKASILYTNLKTKLQNLSVLDRNDGQNGAINITRPDQNNPTALYLKGTDFTLRKRIKTKRKYHRKRTMPKGGLIFPRRRKFILETRSFRPESSTLKKEELISWRPSAFRKASLSLDATSNKVDIAKQKKRVKTNPARLRQLRRRELQQVVKPTQRFHPTYGGFVWPGDYLRLEFTDFPKLLPAANGSSKTDLVRANSISDNYKNLAKLEKAKIPNPLVGVIPRKYLLEKHNIKVLKKKLEKAQQSHKIEERKQQLKFFLSNQ